MQGLELRYYELSPGLGYFLFGLQPLRIELEQFN